jgi:hypothetical protein
MERSRQRVSSRARRVSRAPDVVAAARIGISGGALTTGGGDEGLGPANRPKGEPAEPTVKEIKGR